LILFHFIAGTRALPRDHSAPGWGLCILRSAAA
jgi:hypothetical protein